MAGLIFKFEYALRSKFDEACLRCFFCLVFFTFTGCGLDRTGGLILNNIKSFPTQNLQSIYFDQVMGYKNSEFQAISLTELIDKVPAEPADGFLLDCYDDYQGFISINDVRKYDLRLATKIKIAPETLSILVQIGVGTETENMKVSMFAKTL